MIYRRLVGALTFYGANGFDGTEKRSRASVTNFPVMIAFNETARAQQPLAAGQRGDPTSRHFFDRARLPTEGRFQEVAHYRECVLAGRRGNIRPALKGPPIQNGVTQTKKALSQIEGPFLDRGRIAALLASDYLGVTVTIILV